MKASAVPFPFIFDHLLPVEVTIKPMFGMYAVYVGPKIMLILRQREKRPESNGVWVATQARYHESLRADLSVLTWVKAGRETEWLLIPLDSEDFEPSVVQVCEYIVKGDERIGRIPDSSKRKRK